MSVDISHIPVGQPHRVLVLQDPFWERQKGETSKAFAAFVLYRDDESGRSLAKVALQLGKSKPLMERWSSHWKWTIRVQAYEAHKDKERLEETRKVRREAIARQLSIGQGLQHVGASVVKNFLDEIEKGTIPGLSAKDVKEWIDVGVKIERLALGEPTEHTMSDTPEMAMERRLRDAVTTVRESMRDDPDMPQETLMEWAVIEFNVDLNLLAAALSAGVIPPNEFTT
jgi:hypothetical protein